MTRYDELLDKLTEKAGVYLAEIERELEEPTGVFKPSEYRQAREKVLRDVLKKLQFVEGFKESPFPQIQEFIQGVQALKKGLETELAMLTTSKTEVTKPVAAVKVPVVPVMRKLGGTNNSSLESEIREEWTRLVAEIETGENNASLKKALRDALHPADLRRARCVNGSPELKLLRENIKKNLGI